MRVQGVKGLCELSIEKVNNVRRIENKIGGVKAG